MQSIPPASSCKCSDWTTPKECTGAFFTIPLEAGYIYLSGGDRPQGLCQQIDCGKCYIYVCRECAVIYLCSNQWGGAACGGSFGDCSFVEDPPPLEATEWFRTDDDCCMNYS